MKAVHITTVHQRFDSRIFYKECLSLKNNGWQVTLIVADGKGDETRDGVEITDIGIESSRVKRLLFSSKKAVKKALEIDADVYHFHDPDLLIAARKLCSQGKKVIFDSHEDFPLLMYQRTYIPKPLRGLFHFYALHTQKTTYKKLFGVVTATENIAKNFLSYGKGNVRTVKNYPILEASEKKDKTDLQPTACYVGGLTKIRGVEQMIDACEKANVKLILAGPFDDKEFLSLMQQKTGWKNVEYLGVLPHNELKEKVYDRATIGLNLLLDAPNHKDAIPIKQMEYMANHLPVVTTSHITFCREITDKTHCGIIVTPENTDEVAEAIKRLVSNKAESDSMAENGYCAVMQEYNWQSQEKVLLDLYSLI